MAQSPRFASTAIHRSLEKKKRPPTWFSCPSFHTPGALGMLKLQSNKYHHNCWRECKCIVMIISIPNVGKNASSKPSSIVALLFFFIYALSAAKPDKKCVVTIIVITTSLSASRSLGRDALPKSGTSASQDIAYMQGLGHVADIIRVWRWAWVMLQRGLVCIIKTSFQKASQPMKHCFLEGIGGI